MDKIMTNSPLDKLTGGIENDVITNIYGPAGSGKTNIILAAVLSCIESKKKVLYIDTESSFSTERFAQIGGSEKKMNEIIFIEPSTWKEQHDYTKKIEKVINDVGLIVIDSLVTLYRLELDNTNFQKINKQLATQYSLLSRIARKNKIPVLVTNQVYSFRDMENEKIELTSRTIGKYWSRALIELKKTDRHNHRIAIVRKHRSVPEGKTQEFEITEKGMKDVGKFGFI